MRYLIPIALLLVACDPGIRPKTTLDGSVACEKDADCPSGQLCDFTGLCEEYVDAGPTADAGPDPYDGGGLYCPANVDAGYAAGWCPPDLPWFCESPARCWASYDEVFNGCEHFVGDGGPCPNPVDGGLCGAQLIPFAEDCRDAGL